MMYWIYFILPIALFIFAIFFLAFLLKRLVLYVKIKRLCRKNGYILHRAHAFAFFGRRNGKNFDLYIERNDDIWAVKLFFLPFKLTWVYFCESREYFLKFIIPLPILAWTTDTVHSPIYCKRKALKYEIKSKELQKNGKKIKKLLLIPKCQGVRYIPNNGGAILLNGGDSFLDYTVCIGNIKI